MGELSAATGASQVIIWRREPGRAGRFLPDMNLAELPKNSAIDCSGQSWFNTWEMGSIDPYQGECAQLDSVDGLNGSQHLLQPLLSPEGVLMGLLSMHKKGSWTEETTEICQSVSTVLASALLTPEHREAQETQARLARELWFERHLRIILSKLNARLDRDAILQSAVDTLGRILKVTGCLVIRTDSNSYRTSHEYIDQELSPLGLNSSTIIPPNIASLMLQRTTIINETGLRKHESPRYIEGIEALFENGIGSLAGVPIIVSGASFGALIVQSEMCRHWQAHEIQLMESTSQAISAALHNARMYEDVKEQLFNVNLLSNLTRQISTALEHMGKPKDEAPAEPAITAPIKSPLSSRELEVLRLIASGLANREIAQRLFLTESTVELHASRIRKKLKLKSRTALVKYACDNHLV
ncbi:MAG: LuxR C-terminal-related transcriptional regulator [Candidatus Obscuribacterales bacterium]|nr:LuxR C-terminal-related transcriptional regulator [Candidatus Obscuribacterales bacterium]